MQGSVDLGTARLGRWPAVVSTAARLQCSVRPAAPLPAAGGGDNGGGGLRSTHATTTACAPLMSLTTLPPPSLCTRPPTPPPPPPHIRAQQYLSPQHAKAVSGNNSQGPVYKIYVRGEGRGGGLAVRGVERAGGKGGKGGGLGRKGGTRPPLAAIPRLRLTTTADAPHRTAPTHPLTQSSLGQQPESTMHNPGQMTFGTAQRLPKPGKAGAPGPGAYRAPAGLGAQPESRRATCPRAVFGTCTRDAAAKVRCGWVGVAAAAAC